MNANMLKDIDDKVELVRNSKDGCGEVIVKLLKKRIIRVVVQFGFNVEDDGKNLI